MKKFVLVDPTSYQQQQQQPSTELDTQVRNVLDDVSKPDDVKAKLYGQLLTKHTVQQQQQQPEFNLEREVLESVPVSVRHKAKRILRELENNPNVTIEPSGRFVYKQTPIENSNVIDLVEDILRDKKIITGTEPSGWREFAQSLSNLEKYYIQNTRSWNSLKRNPLKRSRVATRLPISTSRVIETRSKAAPAKKRKDRTFNTKRSRLSSSWQPFESTRMSITPPQSTEWIKLSDKTIDKYEDAQ